MACRIGISTTPHDRIDHWKREEGHTRSEILATGLSFSAAQKRETEEAAARGCTSHPGGVDNGRSNWSVYRVWGDR